MSHNLYPADSPSCSSAALDKPTSYGRSPRAIPSSLSFGIRGRRGRIILGVALNSLNMLSTTNLAIGF